MRVITSGARGSDVCERCVVADRPLARMRGLLGRADLPAGEGVLLSPAGAIHTHFMRFAIDAVFLGRPGAGGGRTVVALYPALPAWRGLVPLVRGAHGVLELPVGTIAASDTVAGDVIALETIAR